MSDLAIKAEGIGKRYRIGAAQRYRTLRESLVGFLRRPLLPASNDDGTTDRHIWALRDVSFEVRKGEVVGIIGRNGSGKTTLLRILSRITEPTEGRAEVCGRVGTLLEVGTGFHPELTGRENIFLNGAVLGMSKADIRREFDAIVSFADVERFLDTPVKHYSSGMHVRLAFSVAAHMSPDILVVDEVLAVGDLDFQRKCLGKMEDVARGGRTVLFVSHNMSTIEALCDSGILLDQGRVVCRDSIERCVATYLDRGHDSELPLAEYAADPEMAAQILRISVVDEQGGVCRELPYDRPWSIRIRLACRRRMSKLYLAVHVHDSSLSTLLFSRDFEHDQAFQGTIHAGEYDYEVNVPVSILAPGVYRVSVHVVDAGAGRTLDGADFVCPFAIVDAGSIRARLGCAWVGKLAVPLAWRRVPAAAGLEEGDASV